MPLGVQMRARLGETKKGDDEEAAVEMKGVGVKDMKDAKDQEYPVSGDNAAPAATPRPSAPRPTPPTTPPPACATSTRKLGPPERDEAFNVMDGVLLWRGLLDFENEPLPPGVNEGYGILPQYVLNNTEATLQDMPTADFIRTILALRTVFSIMQTEVGAVIDRVIDSRGRDDQEDGNALMQTSLASAGNGGHRRGHDDDDDEGEDDGRRPDWRPRKYPKVNRRRRLMRRRRTLNNDVAELAVNAGPGHCQAIQNTQRIANQVRHMIGQRRQLDEETGLSKKEGDNLNAAMAARGDRGALLLLAGTLEMLATLILDIRSTVNRHVLADVHRQRVARRRRQRGHRGNGNPGRRDENDGHCLMQMPKPLRDGVQNGEIKDHEVKEIVDIAMGSVKREETMRQDAVKQHLHAMATRNLRSKVPAVRKVSESIMQTLKAEITNKQTKAKRVAQAIWKSVRASSLKWARKRRHQVELLQVKSSHAMEDEVNCMKEFTPSCRPKLQLMQSWR